MNDVRGRSIPSTVTQRPERPRFRRLVGALLLAAAELGEGLTISPSSNPCTIPAREVVEKRGFASVVPVLSAVAGAPDGGIWARRKVVGEEEWGPIDVFDADGSYRGTLPADAPFPLAFLPGDGIASKAVDELDVERIVVYEVVR